MLSALKYLKFTVNQLLHSSLPFKDIKLKKSYILFNRALTDDPIHVIVTKKTKDKLILTLEGTKVELMAQEDTYDDIWFLVEKTSSI